MVDVKVLSLPPLPDGVDVHVVALTDRLLQQVRQALLTQDWDGLRTSHFRLLGCVPPGGTTITELAELLFMTKQAVGQFVAQLEDTGHLVVRTGEPDRRRRVVLRSEEGDRVVARVGATVEALEDHFRELVGAQEYAVFRRVLERIAGA